MNREKSLRYKSTVIFKVMRNSLIRDFYLVSLFFMAL